jgi:hypothetical protein
MKRTDVDTTKAYAFRTPRGIRYGRVLSFKWTAKGEYVESAFIGRASGVLALTRVEGIKVPAQESKALEYTEQRFRASQQLERMFGEDDALDELMLPPRGWSPELLTHDDILMTWADYEQSLRQAELDELEKQATYRKLRNLMARTVAARDAVSAVSRPVAAPAVPEKVGPADIARAGYAKRKAVTAAKVEERKALEQSEVNNFERAIRNVTMFLRAMPDQKPATEDSTHLDAISIVMEVASIVQDEPRTMSARKETVELGAAKKAVYDRWLAGRDADGHDWLESTKPEHVIDIIFGLLIDRGWRPTVTS